MNEQLSIDLQLRDRLWCIALLNTLPLDQVQAVLKAFNDMRDSATPPQSGAQP